MRTFDDIKTMRFDAQGSIKLDLERVLEDPAWNAITGDMPLETVEDLNAALVKYFQYYFANEVILKEVPSTCGPADIYSVRVRVHERRKKDTNEPSSSGAPSGQNEQPALR